MPVSEFLICFHVPANAGYAIEPLERAFYDVASSIVGSKEQVHLGYQNYNNGWPHWLNEETDNFVALNYSKMSNAKLEELASYIQNHNIEYVLAFDLHVGARIIKAFRKGGVRKIISYYGAPMSPINMGIKLLLKRFQVWITPDKPDHFIFESFGMQRTATHGRGIRPDNTSVVHLGIDVNRFSSCTDKSYTHRTLAIPGQRKIIFYAGHMEKRKGVDIIIKAATVLINERGRDELHFLICGNRPGEESAFDNIYKGTSAEDYITFGGYRKDIPELMAGCFAAVIASTGWDSFPRSSLEMAAAGLPLLVSNLAGLNETVVQDVTGLLFIPGDYIDLADKLDYLSRNAQMREQFSRNSAQRVSRDFTLDIQKRGLKKVLKNVIEVYKRPTKIENI